ncbi:MAG: hypothetical protein GF398_05705 [Chitinivibrionales bacterium]|nr:hypothetical protein [Chitinivibrionales bacterium]
MRYCIALLTALIVCTSVFSMDGVAVAYIKTGGNNASERKLVRYDIANDIVVSHDTLYNVPLKPNDDQGAECPTINMSGTHVAFLMDENNTRYVAIMPINGGSPLVTIPAIAHARYLFWMPDGSIIYVGGGSPEISECGNNVNDPLFRRLTLSETNGMLTFSDTVMQKVQKSFDWNLGVARDESRFVVHHRGRGLDCEEVDDIETVGYMFDKSDTPSSRGYFNVSSCGSTCSPSGAYWHHHPGDHDKNTIKTWENAVAYDTMAFDVPWQSTDPACGTFRHIQDYNSTEWARFDPATDPLANLEFSGPASRNEWIKMPIGHNSEKPGWSCNSDWWFWTMLDFPGTGVQNYCVFDFKHHKAINVTKILPGKEVYNYRDVIINNYRGIDFTNEEDNVLATRGALWCSTREDVWEPLYQYVEQQEQYRAQWNNLLDLPIDASSGIRRDGSVGAGADMRARTRRPAVASSQNGSKLHLRFSDRAGYTVRLYDAGGRMIVGPLAVSGAAAIAVPRVRSGIFMLRIDGPGMSLSRKVAYTN